MRFSRPRVPRSGRPCPVLLAATHRPREHFIGDARRVSRCFQSRPLQAQRTDVDPCRLAELHSCGEWIKPIQPREPRKIPICRAQRESMLDGKRREMRIRHEITIHARQCQKLAKYCGVTLGRLGRPRCLRGQPARHLLPCRCHGERTAERSRVGRNPQERKQAWPRQSDRSSPIQLRI